MLMTTATIVLAHGGVESPTQQMLPFLYGATIVTMVIIGAVIGYRTSYDRPRGLASLRSARNRELDTMWATGSWESGLRRTSDEVQAK